MGNTTTTVTEIRANEIMSGDGGECRNLHKNVLFNGCSFQISNPHRYRPLSAIFSLDQPASSSIFLSLSCHLPRDLFAHKTFLFFCFRENSKEISLKAGSIKSSLISLPNNVFFTM
jgi:hypothetical protein